LIDHRTVYRYEAPAAGIVQILRLTPRSSDSQTILKWRVDVEADGAFKPFTDAHGNAAHAFYADGALSALAIHVEGEVLTTDTVGIVGPVEGALPDAVYLRPTALTMPDAGLLQLAEACRRDGALATGHALTAAIHAEVAFDPDVTHAATEAASAYALKRGVCQDLSQILLAAARALGIPARYVSGHYCAPDHPEQEASHAWAELKVDGLGWVAFDPTHGVCAGEGHVRVAVGLDALDAAPVRGSRRGGGVERLQVQVHGRAAGEAPDQFQGWIEGRGAAASQRQGGEA
jgi:transglutaminase-like putative cysteine protease